MKLNSIIAIVVTALMAHTEIVAGQRGIPEGAVRPSILHIKAIDKADDRTVALQDRRGLYQTGLSGVL